MMGWRRVHICHRLNLRMMVRIARVHHIQSIGRLSSKILFGSWISARAMATLTACPEETPLFVGFHITHIQCR
jgi:hypothetical protein